jgi:hypothetical protein
VTELAAGQDTDPEGDDLDDPQQPHPAPDARSGEALGASSAPWTKRSGDDRGLQPPQDQHVRDRPIAVLAMCVTPASQ